MANVQTRTKRGIVTQPEGYYVGEVVEKLDDSGTETWRESCRRILDGPFQGVGAKRAAIKVAGTNTVIA